MNLEEPTWYVGLPSDDHPMNGKLGRYFAATSYIEFSILLCMAAALGNGADINTAFAALKHTQKMSEKLRKLKATAEKSRHIDEYRKKIVLVACEHLQLLIRTRNMYAHGLFEHTNIGDVRLCPFGINDASTNVPRMLKPDRIEGEIMLLDTMLRMAQFVAGRISLEQLQPHLDRLAAAKKDNW